MKPNPINQSTLC